MTGIVQHLCHEEMQMAEECGVEMSNYLFTNDCWVYTRIPLQNTCSVSMKKPDFYPISISIPCGTIVSTMLHNGVDKQTVAELAGHGDTSFLERIYCHPQMELKKQASGRLTNTLFYPVRAEKVQEDTSV